MARNPTKHTDRTQSLQQLEQHDWGEPTSDSHLVTTCRRLRQNALDEFTIEDLRIMIGQEISLPHLMPIALERLESHPLAAGDYYAGDLLTMVLMVDDELWTAHPDLTKRIRHVVRRVKKILPSLDLAEQQTIERILTNGNRLLME